MGGRPSPNLAVGSNLRLDRQDPYLRLDAVNIFVRDQDRSLQFYLDKLGFSLAFDARLQSGQRMVAVAPPDGTAVLTLIAPDPDSREYKLIGRATQVVFVTEDVTAKFREWSKRGVRFRHTPRLRRVKYERAAAAAVSSTTTSTPAELPPVWGGVFTRFEDIDRNSFALVSFDEVSHAVEAQRRATAGKLEAERRAAQELEIAKQVQARLFPQIRPELKTVEYAGVCLQARQVGGDYFDFLNLGPERLGLIIGDVSGKGIAAALLMANLQAALRSQSALAFDQPELLLKSVNSLFYDNTTENAFASLLFADYNDATRRLRYVNCGHLSGLLLKRNGNVEKLEPTSTLLGLFKEWDCSMREQELSPGDVLALYTDGVTEATDFRGEEFGERYLIESLRQHRELSCQALLGTIVDGVRQFSAQEQHDDITAIVAKFRAI